MRKAKTFDEYFQEIDKSGGENACWIWTGVPTSRGYGRLKRNGKQIGAHIYSWIVKNGEVPEGLVIMHTCDTPLCVNPSHLMAGTYSQNMLDMYARKRRKPARHWKTANTILKERFKAEFAVNGKVPKNYDRK